MVPVTGTQGGHLEQRGHTPEQMSSMLCIVLYRDAPSHRAEMNEERPLGLLVVWLGALIAGRSACRPEVPWPREGTGHGNSAARKGHSPFIQLVARGVPGGMDGCPARCLCAHAVDPRVLDVRATGAGARRTCSQKRHGSECMIFPHGISRWARERTKSSAAISIPASGATK